MYYKNNMSEPVMTIAVIIINIIIITVSYVISYGPVCV